MDYQIKSVERAFEILKAISLKPQKPSELVDTLQLNKSTIHRFLSTLTNLSYLERLPDQTFRLSQSFINLALNAQNHYEIVHVAKPYLHELAERFEESALLALFNGNESEYVEKVDSSRAVRIVFEPGARAPVYAVASGKVFLSSLKEDDLEHYLKDLVIEKHTKNTITDKDELLKQVQNVKKFGYAVDNEEFEYGLRGYASPIKDHRGNTIAAICIAGIASRVSEEEKSKKIISSLLSTTREISSKMGYQEEVIHSKEEFVK